VRIFKNSIATSGKAKGFFGSEKDTNPKNSFLKPKGRSRKKVNK